MSYIRLLTLLFSFWIASTMIASGPVSVGRRAPGFTLPTLDGRTSISLEDFRGKVVVVDFWASWCAPCKRSLPELAALEHRYENVKVIAINVDDVRQNAVDFLRRDNISVTAIYDRSKEVVSTFDINGMPSSFIIDRKGIVRYVHLGYTAGEIQNFNKEIELLLSEEQS